MKNSLLIIFLFLFTSGFSQSNKSLNLVMKYGFPKFQFFDHQSHFYFSGKSYTWGFEISQRSKKRKNLSFEYGLHNQLNLLSDKNELQYNGSNGEIFLSESKLSFQVLEVLIPVKGNIHFRNLKMYGGIAPTFYAIFSNFKEKGTTNRLDIDTVGEKFDMDLNKCWLLPSLCPRSGNLPLSKKLEVKYIFGVGYQINRFNLFVEYSDLFWFNKNGRSSVVNENLTLNFGTTFRIY